MSALHLPTTESDSCVATVNRKKCPNKCPSTNVYISIHTYPKTILSDFAEEDTKYKKSLM